jgi:hypothetical protein
MDKQSRAKSEQRGEEKREGSGFGYRYWGGFGYANATHGGWPRERPRSWSQDRRSYGDFLAVAPPSAEKILRILCQLNARGLD